VCGADHPDLQAWVRDRRDAYDALLEKYSGEDLAKLEEVAKELYAEPSRAEPSPAGDSSGIFKQAAVGAPRDAAGRVDGSSQVSQDSEGNSLFLMSAEALGSSSFIRSSEKLKPSLRASPWQPRLC
jgi:hypothetical protein